MARAPSSSSCGACRSLSSAGGSCRSSLRACRSSAPACAGRSATERLDLDELCAVRLDHQRQVRVAGRRAGSSAAAGAICQGVLSQQVGAAHHVGDALRRIVDDHRELVGEAAVAAPDDRRSPSARRVEVRSAPAGDPRRTRPAAGRPGSAWRWARARWAPARQVPGIAALAGGARAACSCTRTSRPAPQVARAPRGRARARCALVLDRPVPVQSRSASSVRSICIGAPGHARARVSRSSMRTSQRPPMGAGIEEAAPAAATSEPRCRQPVGEGAKRPT